MARRPHQSKTIGPSQRQLRVAEEVRRTVHDVLARATWRDPALQDATVTVTGARISPDLKNATLFVAPLGGRNEEAVVAALNHAKAYVRAELARALNHYRVVPDLRFARDDSFEEGGRIDALLRSPKVMQDLREGRGEDEDGPAMARKAKGRDVHGWLILDKAEGLGSTDAVAKAKRLFDAKKAGHAGTLDPLATGVLAIAFGEATKTVPFAMDATKTYRFAARWGAATATDDSEGVVTATSEVRPTPEAILAALPAFVGEISQVPPAFSAVKVDGARAYDLARDGEAFELKARPAWIERLELVAVPGPDEAEFEMVCGKGTYVRALVRDLARALGTLGHVVRLRRTRVGAFGIEDAITLAELAEMGYERAAERHLHPVATALDDIPALAVGEADAARIRSGQAAPVRGSAFSAIESLMRDGGADEAPLVLLKGLDGKALALAEVRLGAFHPTRVFNL